jgi:valyl-tRNA synthetase
LLNIRSTFNIAPSIPLTASIAPADAATRDLIARMEGHIKRLAKIDELLIVDKLEAQKGSARAVVGASEIAVPLEGLIDFEKERARLEKELNKLTNEREGLEKRLSNQDFISRAAVDVVETTRARAEELADQVTKLRAVIEAL